MRPTSDDSSGHRPISEEIPPRRQPLLHWLLIGGSLVVTVMAVLWLARQNEGFSGERFGLLLRSANPLKLVAAALLGLMAYVLRVLRWAALVKPYAHRLSLADLMGNTLIGFMAVILLGRPGELLRPYLISRQIGAPFSSQVGAWLLERIYDLLAVLALAAWALSTMRLDLLDSGSALSVGLRAGGALVLVAAVAAVALLLVFTFATGFAGKRLRDALGVLPEPKRDTATRLLGAFLDAVAVSRHPSCFASLVGYSALHWLAVGLSSWCVFLSLPESAHLGLPDTFRFLALLALGSAVPLPGLVGGHLLIAVLLLTEWLRLPLEAASAIALALWLVQLGITLPLGMVAALRGGLNWRKLKNMEREARL